MEDVDRVADDGIRGTLLGLLNHHPYRLLASEIDHLGLPHVGTPLLLAPHAEDLTQYRLDPVTRDLAYRDHQHGTKTSDPRCPSRRRPNHHVY
ncbi:hypothetical protein SDC9_146124 [bioreactor metagenome]|uniref:Uncharacterized protein n=1 Tax=bioreactor metagenome TaxID=1076179 RepID=A0A645EA80_9ZZZZ